VLKTDFPDIKEYRFLYKNIFCAASVAELHAVLNSIYFVFTGAPVKIQIEKADLSKKTKARYQTEQSIGPAAKREHPEFQMLARAYKTRLAELSPTTAV